MIAVTSWQWVSLAVVLCGVFLLGVVYGRIKP